MVEYAVLVAQTSMATFGSLTRSAEVWLSRLNWEMVGYAALGLVAFRIAAWAFKVR
jgi:hypothetical protein